MNMPARSGVNSRRRHDFRESGHSMLVLVIVLSTLP
jgi:hypothetical protein